MFFIVYCITLLLPQKHKRSSYQSQGLNSISPCPDLIGEMCCSCGILAKVPCRELHVWFQAPFFLKPSAETSSVPGTLSRLVVWLILTHWAQESSQCYSFLGKCKGKAILLQINANKSAASIWGKAVREVRNYFSSSRIQLQCNFDHYLIFLSWWREWSS